MTESAKQRYTEKYSQAEQEEIAHKIEPVLRVVEDLPLDALDGARETAVHLQGNDDAIGCLVQPTGYSERREVRQALIERADALIALKKANIHHKEACIKERGAKRAGADFMRQLGLGMVAIALLLTGCSDRGKSIEQIGVRGAGVYIPADRIEAASRFEIDCIKAAVPGRASFGSDPDLEDVVEECRRSARDLYGITSMGYHRDYQFIPDAQITEAKP